MNDSGIDPLSEAARLLADAREHLLQGVSQAAGARDWTTAKRLPELAERADELRAEVQALAGERIPVAPPAEPTQPARHAEVKRAHPPFPQFEVRGEMLVKRGLQRSGRDIYEHAVPRDRFEHILDRLAEMAAGSGKGR